MLLPQSQASAHVFRPTSSKLPGGQAISRGGKKLYEVGKTCLNNMHMFHITVHKPYVNPLIVVNGSRSKLPSFFQMSINCRMSGERSGCERLGEEKSGTAYEEEVRRRMVSETEMLAEVGGTKWASASPFL